MPQTVGHVRAVAALIAARRACGVLLVAAFLTGGGSWARAAEKQAAPRDWTAAFETAKRTTPGFAVESVQEFQRLAEYYENIKADGVVFKSIELANGDQVLCVEVTSQRSLVASGKPLQLAPETPPAGALAPRRLEVLANRPGGEFGLDGTKDSRGNERACPAGTFPRLVPRLDNLYHFRKLEDVFQKTPPPASGQRAQLSASSVRTQNAQATAVHEYAHARKSASNIGMSADFNLWSPTVETNEFSLSQLWVPRGQTSDNSLQTVETGWQNYPLFYGDSSSHLFIYFTTGNYQSGTGCYNLTCSAFVQTDNTVVLGGSFSVYSVQGGNQYDISLAYFRDPSPPHHWFLRYGSTWVGYFPNTLFDSQGIADHADVVDFGGEITNYSTGGVHTTTKMGSGRFPGEGFGAAAYTKRLQFWDASNTQFDATGLTRIVTDASYYDLAQASSSDTNWLQYFFFGGPGRAASAAPTANFTFPSNQRVGQSIPFTDTSTGGPTAWAWTFGDGGTSTAQNPAHAYLSAGTFPVTLIASNSSGTNTKTQFVTVLAAASPPAANFTFSPSGPTPGQLVFFTDTSTGGPTGWSWTFGDGGSSSQQNPSHAYDLTGTYNVALTASNASGINAITRTVQVSATAFLPYVYVLPSSAHSAGANGAFYTTDLSISNRGTSPANVTIQFVGHDQDGRGGPQQARSLLPGASVTYQDLLGAFFGVTSGYGGIRIKSDSATLKIVGQTSTPPPNGQGTFGQAVPALTSASFVTPATSQALIALRQDAAARTNAVLMNVTDASAHVHLSLVGPDASILGSSDLDLAPASMTQVSAILTVLGAPSGTRDAVVVVTTTTPGAQIACYASVIDNVTNDPRTILP